MNSKTKQIAQDDSRRDENEASELSFEDFDKKYGIKLKYPPTGRIPGFPVSETSGFRWLSKDEMELIDEYVSGRRNKPRIIVLKVALFKLWKRMRR